MILSGELKPGQPITEREMLEMFNVSRTPLREALRKLHNEHLIDISSSRRMSVACPCREDTWDRLVVLQSLESCAIRLAAEQADADEIKTLRSLQEKMRNNTEDGQSIQYFEYNLAFHRKIVDMSRNDFLIQTHSEYDNALYRHRFLSCDSSASNRKKSVIEHDQIIDAMENKESTLAEKIMFNHLRAGTMKNVEEYWKKNPLQ